MDHTDIIQYFCNTRHYNSYLEIGSAGGNTIKSINCSYKIAVDPNPAAYATHHMTSDEYFDHHCKEKFDIIFIDGYHVVEQVDRDIRNALTHLNDGGVIILHDCIPIDKYAQSQAALDLINRGVGISYNGTVWKSVLKYMSTCLFECYIIDTDHGCGIIDTLRPRSTAITVVPTILDYDEHIHLLNYHIISVADFETLEPTKWS